MDSQVKAPAAVSSEMLAISGQIQGLLEVTLFFIMTFCEVTSNDPEFYAKTISELPAGPGAAEDVPFAGHPMFIKGRMELLAKMSNLLMQSAALATRQNEQESAAAKDGRKRHSFDVIVGGASTSRNSLAPGGGEDAGAAAYQDEESRSP